MPHPGTANPLHHAIIVVGQQRTNQLASVFSVIGDAIVVVEVGHIATQELMPLPASAIVVLAGPASSDCDLVPVTLDALPEFLAAPHAVLGGDGDVLRLDEDGEDGGQ